MWRIFLPIFQTVGHLRLAYHLPSHFLYCWRAGGRRPPFGNATLIRKAISGMQTEQRYAPSLLGQLPVKHTALLSPLRVPVTWLMVIPASLDPMYYMWSGCRSFEDDSLYRDYDTYFAVRCRLFLVHIGRRTNVNMAYGSTFGVFSLLRPLHSIPCQKNIIMLLV